MIYLLGANIVTFIIYGMDKLQAIRKKERIPERLLLILSVIGGCYGSFLGMVIFHHKIRKRKFKVVISLTIILWSLMICKGGIR